MKKIFGYARVSSKDQNLDRQIRILKDYVKSEQDIFTDKKSGKDIDRDNYGKLKTQVREGDIIVCTELDRFARSKLDIKNELQYFKSEGVKVVFLDIPTTKIFLDDSESFEKVNDIFEMVNNILIEVIATMAEKERKKIRKRQLQGIQEAKRKGVKFGRPKKINLEDPKTKKKVLELIKKVENKEITNREASVELSISTRYFYTIKNKLDV